MEFADLDLAQEYTYADYLRWTFDERLEIIKGKLFKMSPAPSRSHQKLSWEIARELADYLKGKTCEAYSAPFDVRLPRKSKNDKDIVTVVQPDLCVICDPAKLDDKGCLGAPDIIIEILSPGNNKKELTDKYEVYEEAGVKEYWLVMYQEKICIQYTHNNWTESSSCTRPSAEVYRHCACCGKKLYFDNFLPQFIDGHFFTTRPLTVGDILTTPILPGFSLDLAEVFRQI